MPDSVLHAFAASSSLRVVVCVAPATVAEAVTLHELSPASGLALSQGLLGGLLIAALQKGDKRINLQLECDGPLRGFLVDASTRGEVRGYVKNRFLTSLGASEAFRWRTLLGNSGFISVLRDVGEGEFYRSSVELQAMELGADLQRYFLSSDQTATRVALAWAPVPVGVLVQALPDADLSDLERLTIELETRLQRVIETLGADGVTAEALARRLFEGDPTFQVLEQRPVTWTCTCSKERVLNALVAMGKAELQDMLAKEGKAVATCQFCGRTHTADAADLQTLLLKLGDQPQ